MSAEGMRENGLIVTQSRPISTRKGGESAFLRIDVFHRRRTAQGHVTGNYLPFSGTGGGVAPFGAVVFSIFSILPHRWPPVLPCCHVPA